MSAAPLVSIVIPVFNGARYLGEAIDSALAQSYPHVEVIVVNDGSRDGGATEGIALSYRDRIRYFKKANGGVSTALNLGLEEMRGEYFSWLSHDDLYEPDKIRKQLAAVLAHEGGQAFAYCDFRLVAKDGAEIGNFKVSPQVRLRLRPLLAIGGGAGLHGCGLFLPRIFFDRYGRFDPARPCTQDNEFWFRFADKEPAVHVAEALVIGRVHDQQVGLTQSAKCTRESDLLHASQIGELSEAEIDGHMGHSVDALIRSYEHHRCAGYPKKALQLLKHLCRLARRKGEETKALPSLTEAIVRGDDPRRTRQFWDEVYLPVGGVAKERPRILVYTNVWFRGGTERGIATILSALKDRYEWILVTSDLERQGGFALPQEIRHVRLTEREPRLIAPRLASLGAILDVDLFLGFPNIVGDLLDAYELFEGIGVRTIAANRAGYFLPYRYKNMAATLRQRLAAFEHATAVVWQTTFAERLYSHLAPNGAHLPNPNPVAAALPRAVTRNKVVLAVGRFYDPIKRLDRMLEVFARVLVLHPDANLVLVGGYDPQDRIPGGSPRNIQELLDHLGLRDGQVRFVGEVDDVGPFYREATVLVLTSESEGLPNVMLEAGAHGLPVVYFEIPGLEDVITDGENGFAVPQGDLDLMAGRVCALLADEVMRDGMGQKGRELVRRFDQGRLCDRWGALIELVLTARDRADLNRALAERFRDPHPHPPAFAARVLVEYEQNLRLLIDQFNAVQSPRSLAYSRAHRLLTSLEQEGLAATLTKVARKARRRLSG